MRKTYVKPVGPPNAKLAICGEQPGKHEIFKGQPFVGPAGQELWKILYPIGIARHDVYVTNVIKDLDAHLKTYIDISPRSGPVVSNLGWEYINELKNELETLSPNVVLALGNIALFALTSRTGISKWAGSVIESTLVPGLKIIPTFHPATVIAPKFQYLNRHLIRFDARRALEESTTPAFLTKPRKVIIEPTFDQAMAYLQRCYEEGLKGRIIEWDIEVVNEELNCFSIAYRDDEAMSIPLVKDGDYFTISQEYEILLALARILEHPSIPYGGANNIFDCQFMLHKYGIRPRGEHHCTQIAQKITWPDYNAGLDFVTRMHTDIPYYKADGKKWMKIGGPWHEWWTYNAMDSIATASARGPQIEELSLQNNLETYNRQRALVNPLLYMMERGIRVDVEGMKREQEKEQHELEQLQEKLNSIAGCELNPNSPKQLMDYFYLKKGLRPYKKRSTTGAFVPTTDVDALKRLAKPTSSRKGFEEAQIILKMRGLQKRISTYLDIKKVDPDGRYRSQYKPAGTETGRLASGETIFGSGGNQQNIPHDILQFFLADEGYIIVSIDLSQIENRIVAYVGNVVPMIKAFESGTDVHSLTAAMIFDKPIEQVSDEDGSCSLGDGRQSERYWGKKCVLETAEVLTPRGWLPIGVAKHYNFPIAQWDKSGTISFVTPLEWYESRYSGDIITIENQRIFQEATPDHKMPLRYGNSIITKPISKYPRSGNYRAPLSGVYSGNISIPDPIIRFLVAFQADGHWNNNGITFKLYKPRKITRIKAILELAGIKYNDNPSQIYISAKHDLCKLTKALMGKDKLFGDWLLELDQQSLLTFLDELPYWDGYIAYHKGTEKREYFTTIRQNAEWVQTIAHLCNKASNICEQDNSKTSAFGNKILYRVNIRNSTAPATSAIRRSVRKVVNQKIFCPTVPSGFFLIKDNGKISVTGNSNHALNYDFGYKSFALRYEITEKEANWLVEKYHQSYPGVRQNYHAMIQSQLKKDRTITNLFGRRRIFMGPVVPDYPNVTKAHCHNTFKEAYAHLPQSTTADKINEHGVNYIYYNQQWFEPVELLTQIHDSVVFQIPISIGWVRMAEIIKRVKDSLERPLRWHDIEFAVPADTSIGLNMFKKHMKEIKSRDFPTSISILATKLEEIYNEISKSKS